MPAPVKTKKGRPQPKRPPAPPCPTRGKASSVASDSKSAHGRRDESSSQPATQHPQQPQPTSRRQKARAAASARRSDGGGSSFVGDACAASTANSSTVELPRAHPLLFLRERSLSLSSISDGECGGQVTV